jgi:hypothetical protein
LTAVLAAAVVAVWPARHTTSAQVAPVPPIVFVSRAIPAQGTVYWNVPRGLPGVMAYSRFQVASPGRLLVRQSDGQIRVLVDGAQPAGNLFRLADVNAPDVSWDGQRIVFAGLPEGNHSREPVSGPGAWRLFVINLDGSGLRQLTRSDRAIDLSQFGSLADRFSSYDDTDPAWLPDGRVVFSSTRWPAFAQYGGARSTNLFVVNADGSGMHRITGERNGADRPLVDPLTGRIVYSRWWRNYRFASNDLSTVMHPSGGFRRHLGLVASTDTELGGIPGGPNNLQRNSWHLISITPDGSDMAQFAGESGLFFEAEDDNHAYGGSFAADGTLFANFFPMKNGTEASGFGGVRHFARGVASPTPVIGITTNLNQQYVSQSPRSFGVYVGSYAAEPEVLPDGRLIVSGAPDVFQDYGLYVANADGSGATLLYDEPGRTELRARVAAPRPLPPILPDAVTHVASALPPRAQGPYDIDGTFLFDSLNVFFNAPVDVPIINAPGVGSASLMAFFLDHQRLNPGSFERLDWPILLGTAPVAADGSVAPTPLPANLPLFEQLRSAQMRVPFTGRGSRGATPGAAHVAGMNYGRTGTRARCVGCHAGHTMIPVPPTDEEARWTNLAPGAAIVQSSVDPALEDTDGLVDRRVRTGRPEWFWRSHPSQSPDGQWVGLRFPLPVRVRTVRLYNPPQSDTLTTRVQSARVRLFADDGGQQEQASFTTGPISDDGTDVPFSDVVARMVGIEFLSVTGRTRYMNVASLAEVEVIARGEGAVPCAAPGPPAALGASVAGSRVSLSWQPPATGAPTRYVVEAGSAPGLANLAVLPLAGEASSFAVDAPNGRYFVRVRAANACGAGGASNEVVVDVPGACAAPVPPGSISVMVSGGRVSLGWPAVPGAAGYVLEAGSAPGASDVFVGPVSGAGVQAAPPAGRYYVRLRARSACGAVSGPSGEVVVNVP